MAALRNCTLSLLAKAVATTSESSVRFGRVHLGARGSSHLIERSRTMSGGLHARIIGQRPPFESSVSQPVPGQSRRYAVAQPFPEGWDMEVEEGGSEEVVGGCLVQHGQVWNGDVKIHYVECGDKNGELVVLIHGFPNFWYVWKNQFQALSEAGYRVVAPDLRGYNTSSKPDGIQYYGRCGVVSDMVSLIDQLGNGKPATVVGHDWGGFVTWALAEDFPQKVKKAVLVNAPHSSVFGSVLRSSLKQMRRSWYIGFFQLPWLPEWLMTGNGCKTLKVALGIVPGFQPVDVERHVKAYEKAGVIKGAINYYRAAFRGYWPAVTPRSTPVELPVDLIWGERDDFLGIELAIIPSTIATNAVIKLLPHSSHWPMWDDPKQFNSVLLDSIRSHHATPADQVHDIPVVSLSEGLVD